MLAGNTIRRLIFGHGHYIDNFQDSDHREKETLGVGRNKVINGMIEGDIPRIDNTNSVASCSFNDLCIIIPRKMDGCLLCEEAAWYLHVG